MVTANVQIFKLLYNYLNQRSTRLLLKIYIIHSDIPNCTKLAFNSLKMIQNDTVSQLIKQGMIGL